MNRINLKLGAIYLEIGQSTLHVLRGEEGLELPLDRLPNGRLSTACKQNLTSSLRSFLRKESWRPQPRAFCAISARGVSLRRITLPTTSKENLQRLLLLQIESEFPLSPEELAWGYLPLNPAKATGNGASGQQEYLIAAVKKEVIDEYAELLAGCGVSPVFTVAAMARPDLCPKTTRPQALLDIGRYYSELVLFENGVARTIRVISWGGEAITQSIAHSLGITHTEAEDLKLKLAQGYPGPELDKLQSALQEALEGAAKAVSGQGLGEKIYLTGQTVRLKDLAPGLARRLPTGVACEGLEPSAGSGRSAAILALKSAAEQGQGSPPLILAGRRINGSNGVVRNAPWKLCALAAGLACAVLVVPYLEAVTLKPFLVGRLAALKEGRRKLALIDAEWSFFQHLKQNAPPYLDALFLLAKASPQGARVESLSMNQRGDVSLRCSMQNSQQVTDFRSKLIDSGFFAAVTIEEQTPSPDRQKLAIRMSAQWKPLSARQALAVGPTKEEIEKAKTRVREPQMGGGPMMPMMPPMAGPGMPGPMPMPQPPPRAGPPERVRPPRVVPPDGVPPDLVPPGPPPPTNP